MCKQIEKMKKEDPPNEAPNANLTNPPQVGRAGTPPVSSRAFAEGDDTFERSNVHEGMSLTLEQPQGFTKSVHSKALSKS